MAGYYYNNKTITIHQIEIILVHLLGTDKSISISSDVNIEQPIDYKRSQVAVYCNRCGATTMLSPKYIIDSAYDKQLGRHGCVACAYKSDEALKQERRSNLDNSAKVIEMRKNENANVRYTEAVDADGNVIDAPITEDTYNKSDTERAELEKEKQTMAEIAKETETMKKQQQNVNVEEEQIEESDYTPEDDADYNEVDVDSLNDGDDDEDDTDPSKWLADDDDYTSAIGDDTDISGEEEYIEDEPADAEMDEESVSTESVDAGTDEVAPDTADDNSAELQEMSMKLEEEAAKVKAAEEKVKAAEASSKKALAEKESLITKLTASNDAIMQRASEAVKHVQAEAKEREEKLAAELKERDTKIANLSNDIAELKDLINKLTAAKSAPEPEPAIKERSVEAETPVTSEEEADIEAESLLEDADEAKDPDFDKEEADRICNTIHSTNTKIFHSDDCFPLNVSNIAYDGVHVTCRVCGEEFVVRNADDIKLLKAKPKTDAHGNIIVHGGVIHACPKCKAEYRKYGYLKTNKEKVLKIIKKQGWKILNEKSYVFDADANSKYTVVDDGVQDARLLKSLSWLVNNEPVVSTESVKPQPEQPVVSNGSKSARELLNAIHRTKTFVETQHQQAAKPQPQPTSQPRTSSGGMSALNKLVKAKKAAVSAEAVHNVRVQTGTENIKNYARQSAYDAALESESDIESERAKEHKVFKLPQSGLLIAKDEAVLDGRSNPFNTTKDLVQQFHKSIFGEFNADLEQHTGINGRLFCGNITSDVPIVDFDNPELDYVVRLIYADLKQQTVPTLSWQAVESGLRDVKYPKYPKLDNLKVGETISKTTEFKKIRRFIIFDDIVNFKFAAAINALTKYIAPETLNYGGKRIMLRNEVARNRIANIQYTKYDPIVKDFENEYDPAPEGKPQTENCQLAITAQYRSDVRTTTRQAKDFVVQVNNMLNRGAGIPTATVKSMEEDLNCYVVASIRYIKIPSKDVVNYTITQYTEMADVMIGDGLKECIRALLCEHLKTYGYLVQPHILFEYDPNTIPSPTILRCIAEKFLLPATDQIKELHKGNTNLMVPLTGYTISNEEYMRMNYIKTINMRKGDVKRDWKRMDMRKFSPATLRKLFERELKESGMMSRIDNPADRLAWLHAYGYVCCNINPMKEYFISDADIALMLSDAATMYMGDATTYAGAANPQQYLSAMVNNEVSGLKSDVLNSPGIATKWAELMRNGTQQSQDIINRGLFSGPNFQQPYQQPMPNQGFGMPNMMGNGTMNPMGMMNMGMGMGMPPNQTPMW